MGRGCRRSAAAPAGLRSGPPRSSRTIGRTRRAASLVGVGLRIDRQQPGSSATARRPVPAGKDDQAGTVREPRVPATTDQILRPTRPRAGSDGCTDRPLTRPGAAAPPAFPRAPPATGPGRPGGSLTSALGGGRVHVPVGAVPLVSAIAVVDASAGGEVGFGASGREAGSERSPVGGGGGSRGRRVDGAVGGRGSRLGRVRGGLVCAGVHAATTGLCWSGGPHRPRGCGCRPRTRAATGREPPRQPKRRVSGWRAIGGGRAAWSTDRGAQGRAVMPGAELPECRGPRFGRDRFGRDRAARPGVHFFRVRGSSGGACVRRPRHPRTRSSTGRRGGWRRHPGSRGRNRMAAARCRSGCPGLPSPGRPPGAASGTPDPPGAAGPDPGPEPANPWRSRSPCGAAPAVSDGRSAARPAAARRAHWRCRGEPPEVRPRPGFSVAFGPDRRRGGPVADSSPASLVGTRRISVMVVRLPVAAGRGCAGRTCVRRLA